MEQSKVKIQKHIKGYKEAKEHQVAQLKEMGFEPAKIRSMMKLWHAIWDLNEAKHDVEIDWYEGMPPFRDPEYRIHPILGHQVRSRHHFEPEGLTQEQRLAEKKHTPRRKPKITPYDLDPDYKDPKEPVHGEADLKGVKQYPVTLEDVDLDISTFTPVFSIKSARLSRAVKILELKIGYDHKTNRRVLYSPLKYNERWDRQSQVIWLRTIGMTPVNISKRLDIKYDTVKNWLRALKGQPLVATSKYDWAVRQVEGRGEYFSKFSSTEAKPRAPEVIQ